jgi:anaerobic magnesium-protoporphyrin IX monomethyl ester cyclase
MYNRLIFIYLPTRVPMQKHAEKKLIGFIIPPYFNGDDYVENTKTAVLPAFTIPYGILSLITFLESKIENYEYHLLDLNICLKDCLDNNIYSYQSHLDEEIVQFVNKYNFNIFGISALFNSSSKYLRTTSDLIKKHSTNSIIIAGGGLPSAAYFEILNSCPSIDAICKGEGEIPLLDLLSSNNYFEVLNSHKSWLTRDSLEKSKIPSHTFIENLDDIPPFNYSIVDLDNYNSRGIDKKYITSINKREMAIHTSRGCPFKCVFCSNPSLHGYDVRTMSIDRVISDVERMRDNFGMNVLMIEDDHFFNDKKRAKEILRRLADLKIRCEFPNGVAVYAIDDEVASLFAAAGVSAVALAIESGSDYVLNKLMKKPLKVEKIYPAVASLRKANVRAHAFMVIGIPGEEDSHREETRQMLLRSDIDWVHMFCAIPIFGSRLFEICKENGFIDLSGNADDYITTKSVIKAPGIDPVKISNFVYQTQLEVNFVNNGNLINNRIDIALPYLKNVIDKYPNHAYGQYYYAKCMKVKGELDSYNSHISIAKKIFSDNEEWRTIASVHGGEIHEFSNLSNLKSII